MASHPRMRHWKHNQGHLAALQRADASRRGYMASRIEFHVESNWSPRSFRENERDKEGRTVVAAKSFDASLASCNVL